MTSARIQLFSTKYNINIGCYVGFKVCPRTITQRNTAIKKHDNHFCLIWRTDGISFDRAMKELKDNFKVISDKHVRNYNN